MNVRMGNRRMTIHEVSCRCRNEAPGAAPCPRASLPMRRRAGAWRNPAASGATGGRAAALTRSLRCAAAGLLLAFAALLALPLQAQAQTVETLVSNTGQGGSSGLNVGVADPNKWSMAVGFTTGDNAGGYTLSSVQAVVSLSGSDQVQVSIYGSDGSGNPGSSLYVLTNPASIVDSDLNTFTALANATLEQETKYFVVFEAPTGSVTIRITNSNAEDSGKANGWSISNRRHTRASDAGSWSQGSNASKPKIAVMGTVNGGTTTDTPATGTPEISGTAQVGQELTASTIDIMDDDGLPASFTYQWVRVDADGVSNETNIGSDASTYTPVAADVGKTIKVTVRFTDNAGNAEGPLESDAYPSAPPGATVVAAQGSCPAGADWCATLTVGIAAPVGDITPIGFGTSHGALDDPTIDYGGKTFTVARMLILDSTVNVMRITLDAFLPRGSVFNLGGTEFTANQGSETSNAGQYSWVPTNLGWLEGQQVTVSVKLDNFAAEGMPEISGTAVVGQELTAAVGTIADPDGLPVGFTYQWVRVDADGSNPTDIGTDSSTYTLVAADEGKKVKVTVRFTDDAGYAEGPLESDATATVVAAASPCPADADWCATLTVGIAAPVGDITPIGFGTSHGALDDPTIDYGGKTFTVARMLILDSTVNVMRITLDAFLPRGSVFNLGGTEFTANQGSETSNAGQYSWVPTNLGWLEGQQVTVSVKLDNFAAEGMPEISGTAVVGQELTAAVGTIADPDGLPVGFTYQWVRVDADGSNPTDIGTDSSTYTLVAADEGKKVKVTVRFTDDAGYAEGPLESDATATVVAAAGPCPADADWCATLTVGIAAPVGDITPIGFGTSHGALDDPTIDYGGKTFTVARMLILDSTVNVMRITLDAFLPRGSVFNLGGTEFTANQGSETSNAGQYSWVPTNLGWLEGQQVTVSVKLDNFAAEGMPEISGVPQVGQELSAAVGTIADPDGLPSTFPDEYTFQWARVVGGTETDITGATSNTYTPVTTDAGNTIKVKASFTDGAGHAEGPLESDATVAVAVAVPTAAGVTVSKTALTVTEQDTTGGSYTVVLDSEPAATVTVTVAGHGRDPDPGHPDLHHVGLGNGPDGDGDRGRRCGHHGRFGHADPQRDERGQQLPGHHDRRRDGDGA